MSALAELDRYIKDHDTSLHSLGRSVLQRNPLDRSMVHSSSSNHHSVAHTSTKFGDASIENELQSFIARLKQMQQFRVAQLKKVQALFTHEIELEDECDLNIKTEEEINKMNEENEFEAFLLGETKDEADRNEESVPPAPPAHSTLFTKGQATSALNTTQETTRAAIHDEKKADAGVEEDSFIQLQRTRVERGARLKTIADSILAWGQQATITTPTVVQAKGSLESKGEANRTATTAASITVPDYKKVLQLPDSTNTSTSRGKNGIISGHRVITTPLQASAQVMHSPSYATTRAAPSQYMHELPPPTGALYTETTEPAPRPPSHDIALPPNDTAALTLQAIAEDDLYLSGTSAAVSSVAPPLRQASMERDSPHSVRLKRNPRVHPAPNETEGSTARHLQGNRASETKAPRPFLVSNARRRQAEGRTNHAVMQDRSSVSPPHKRSQDPRDLSLSTIAHHAGSISSNSGSGSEGEGSAEEGESEAVAGIGFGHRYRSQHVVETRKVRLEKVHPEIVEGGADGVPYDTSSVGSQDSLGGAESERSAGHERIFDYMEALESPVRRGNSGSAVGGGASGGRPSTQQPRSAEEAEEDQRIARMTRIAQLAAQARGYYQRRLHRLETGEEALQASSGEGKDQRVDSVEGDLSPVRVRDWTASYDSPTPTTPKVLPLFS